MLVGHSSDAVFAENETISMKAEAVIFISKSRLDSPGFLKVVNRLSDHKIAQQGQNNNQQNGHQLKQNGIVILRVLK